MINKLSSISTHSNQSLKINLLDLSRKYCNFRIQAKLGKLKQLHLLKKTRRDIAVIKYCLSHKKISI